MGYHRPAVLHKDDRMVFLKQGCGGQGPGRFRAGRSKLLNKRGFRGRIEFPLARKTRYNSPDYRVERRCRPYLADPVRAKTRHWLGNVSCLHG